MQKKTIQPSNDKTVSSNEENLKFAKKIIDASNFRKKLSHSVMKRIDEAENVEALLSVLRSRVSKQELKEVRMKIDDHFTEKCNYDLNNNCVELNEREYQCSSRLTQLRLSLVRSCRIL